MSEHDERRIKLTAEELLRTLETPIHGTPSVAVKNREFCLRFIAGAFEAVFTALTTDDGRMLAQLQAFHDEEMKALHHPEAASAVMGVLDRMRRAFALKG